MRQRALTALGDYSFGANQPFLIDSPYCVAQAIMTRLKLSAGDWFLDLLEGTRYKDLILGHNTAGSRDLAIRSRILDTPGVLQIREYISFVDSTRAMVVVATVDTIYGVASFTTTATL